MPAPADELDLPTLTEPLRDATEAVAVLDDLRSRHWLVRVPFGYLSPDHDDVVAALRDQRWFNAAPLVAEQRGITDERFTRNDRPSILGTEGGDHQRLRRLVGPAFTPKAADRLRPFMRTVLDELVEPIAGQAVEEAMRYLGAVRGTGRYASEDVVYRDVLFPKGTFLFPSLLGGNHDPAVWEEAGSFDITRDRPAAS